MNIVGPRSKLLKFFHLIFEEQKRKYDVSSAITWLIQVSDRNRISWTKKYRYNVYYVDKILLLLDIKILFLTFKKILVSEGVKKRKDRSMFSFKGKN